MASVEMPFTFLLINPDSTRFHKSLILPLIILEKLHVFLFNSGLRETT